MSLSKAGVAILLGERTTTIENRGAIHVAPSVSFWRRLRISVDNFTSSSTIKNIRFLEHLNVRVDKISEDGDELIRISGFFKLSKEAIFQHLGLELPKNHGASETVSNATAKVASAASAKSAADVTTSAPVKTATSGKPSHEKSSEASATTTIQHTSTSQPLKRIPSNQSPDTGNKGASSAAVNPNAIATSTMPARSINAASAALTQPPASATKSTNASAVDLSKITDTQTSANTKENEIEEKARSEKEALAEQAKAEAEFAQEYITGKPSAKSFQDKLVAIYEEYSQFSESEGFVAAQVLTQQTIRPRSLGPAQMHHDPNDVDTDLVYFTKSREIDLDKSLVWNNILAFSKPGRNVRILSIIPGLDMSIDGHMLSPPIAINKDLETLNPKVTVYPRGRLSEVISQKDVQVDSIGKVLIDKRTGKVYGGRVAINNTQMLAHRVITFDATAGLTFFQDHACRWSNRMVTVCLSFSNKFSIQAQNVTSSISPNQVNAHGRLQAAGISPTTTAGISSAIDATASSEKAAPVDQSDLPTTADNKQRSKGKYQRK